ncbi:MAG: SMC-Scp complex subunit ScpB [Lachnospiraceae bacterium]|nr:SMC-Scp complex subunit ScpB [Lachnospiraceae bacterium]
MTEDMDFDSVDTKRKIRSAIEAILFATGRAVASEDLGRAVGISAEEADLAAAALAAEWDEEGRGTQIIRIEDGWQMCTRNDYFPQLIELELTPRKPRMTEVLMETLAVIAYKQPVTKSEIERIRGVNSDHAVNRLVEYHLVKELGRAKLPGRPILFGTTQDFLRLFGVSSREKLPSVSASQVAGFRAEAEAEAGPDAGAVEAAEAVRKDELPEIDRGERDEMPEVGV